LPDVPGKKHLIRPQFLFQKVPEMFSAFFLHKNYEKLVILGFQNVAGGAVSRNYNCWSRYFVGYQPIFSSSSYENSNVQKLSFWLASSEIDNLLNTCFSIWILKEKLIQGSFSILIPFYFPKGSQTTRSVPTCFD